MPTITINGVECEFEQGQTILQIANVADHAEKIGNRLRLLIAS